VESHFSRTVKYIPILHIAIAMDKGFLTSQFKYLGLSQRGWEIYKYETVVFGSGIGQDTASERKLRTFTVIYNYLLSPFNEVDSPFLQEGRGRAGVLQVVGNANDLSDFKGNGTSDYLNSRTFFAYGILITLVSSFGTLVSSFDCAAGQNEKCTESSFNTKIM
jgi:hypothetical protein